jgi:parallel beta-helix repeat protein
MLKKKLSYKWLTTLLLLLLCITFFSVAGFKSESNGWDVQNLSISNNKGSGGKPVPYRGSSASSETTETSQDTQQNSGNGTSEDQSLMESTDIISLKADGSGDYKTFEEALQAVPEGGTIIFETGTYNLVKKLEIKKAISLIGTGKAGETVINGSEGVYVILYSGKGPFIADNITFKYSGTEKANIFGLNSGNAVFKNCQFTGGVRDKNDEGILLGGGIYVYGNANVLLQGCTIYKNGHIGIYGYDNSTMTILNCLCQENSGDGIIFAGNSNGFAAYNKTSGSLRWGGISVQEKAYAVLLNNTSTDNKQYGIGYYHNSGGVAINNLCTGNDWGFYIAKTANPKLKNNVCKNNNTDFLDERME